MIQQGQMIQQECRIGSKEHAADGKSSAGLTRRMRRSLAIE
jgi:hypothetical protein